MVVVDSVCDGNCDGDVRVTIDEIQRAVDAVLAGAPPTACSPADSDGNGAIASDDLIRAVRRALDGC